MRYTSLVCYGLFRPKFDSPGYTFSPHQRSNQQRTHHECGIVTFRFKSLQSSHLSTPLAETIFEMTIHDTNWDFDRRSTSGQHGRLYMNEASKATRPAVRRPKCFPYSRIQGDEPQAYSNSTPSLYVLVIRLLDRLTRKS